MQHRWGSRARLATAAGLVLLTAAGSATAWATAQDVLNLTGNRARLSVRGSVFNEASGRILETWREQTTRRIYNLPLIYNDRLLNLGIPWLDQKGDERWIVDTQLGNNAAEDSLSLGAYKRRDSGLVLGGTATFFDDVHIDGVAFTDPSVTFRTADKDDFTAVRANLGAGWLFGDKTTVGLGLHYSDQDATSANSSFTQGIGGTRTENLEQHDRIGIKGGVRRFVNDNTSWAVHGKVSFGSSSASDTFAILDGAGVESLRQTSPEFDVDSRSVGLGAAYNRRTEHGEWVLDAFASRKVHELNNSSLDYEIAGGVRTDFLTRTDDEINEDRFRIGARGTREIGDDTLIFGGAWAGYWEADSFVRMVDDAMVGIGDLWWEDRSDVSCATGVMHLFGAHFGAVASAGGTWSEQKMKNKFTTDNMGVMSRQDETFRWTDTTTDFNLGLFYRNDSIVADLLFEGNAGGTVPPLPNRRNVNSDQITLSLTWSF